jgi:hypothetical protein
MPAITTAIKHLTSNHYFAGPYFAHGGTVPRAGRADRWTGREPRFPLLPLI